MFHITLGQTIHIATQQNLITLWYLVPPVHLAIKTT